jgi:esterase/lipase superfamily enzyme
LQHEVTNRTNNRQSPDFGSLREDGFDQGDFVFATSPLPSQTSLPPPIALAQSDAPEMLWVLVRDMRRAEVTEAYLKKYPDSPYRLAAEAQITALQKPQPTESEAATDATTSTAVFYATNRIITPDGFGGSRDNELHLGKAVISIPSLHQIGRIELPRNVAVWGASLYRQTLDPLRHFAMLANTPMTPQALPEAVSGTAVGRNSPKKAALVYIHGYNTSFNEALYRAAQLSWDTQFDGAVFLYSWPSAARASQYLADVSSATASEGHLQEFLELLGSKCDFACVHFIAKSQGVMLLMNTLNRMNATRRSSCPIGEIILAGPDIEAGLFDSLCSTIRPLARGVTVYANRNDKGLIVAASLTSSRRAGEMATDGPTIGTCADVVEVTTGDLLGQSYFASRAPLLDIAQLLASGTRSPPSRRLGLREIQGSHGIYWRLAY